MKFTGQSFPNCFTPPVCYLKKKCTFSEEQELPASGGDLDSAIVNASGCAQITS